MSIKSIHYIYSFLKLLEQIFLRINKVLIFYNAYAKNVRKTIVPDIDHGHVHLRRTLCYLLEYSKLELGFVACRQWQDGVCQIA